MDQVNRLVGAKPTVTLVEKLAVCGHSIMPQERHQYDKETQTEFGVKLEGNVADMEKQLRKEQELLMQKEEKLNALMEELKTDKAKYDRLREEEQWAETKVLSREEQAAIESSLDFQNFFSKAGRMVPTPLAPPISTPHQPPPRL